MSDAADGLHSSGRVRHRGLAAGRWWELTVCEQMGHVGSEVGCALDWWRRHPARGTLWRLGRWPSVPS